MTVIPRTAPKVTVIPVKTKTSTQTASTAVSPNKLRVAAYCRVSTDHEEQESSYEAQCTHYRDYISKNPEWELAGIYADEGLSGLRTEKRTEFKRLIDDCMSGKVQMVITKSISRLARNTLDALNCIRKLKAKGIPILFEKENILTTDTKGEILITIMASISQQESASISQNVQMGVRYHYQQGKVGAGHQRFLGYERTEDASLRIVPEEAPIVRRIFREYIEGDSPNLIAKRLTSEHVTWRHNPKGVWHGSTIKYVLKNEKYAGTLLLQKYYTVDFLTKKTARNHGEVPQYLVENNHPPIVPKEVFLQAQGEIMRREGYFQNAFKPGEEERANAGSSVNALSGRIICAECGQKYRRKKESGEAIWRCGTKVDPKLKGGKCDNGPVKEKEIQAAIVKAFALLPAEKHNLIFLEDRMTRTFIDPIDAQMEGLPENDPQRTEMLLQRSEYAMKRIQIQSLLMWIGGSSAHDREGACSNYEDFLQRTQGKTELMTRFDNATVLRFMEKAVIHPDRIEVDFKAGVSIDVER